MSLRLKIPLTVGLVLACVMAALYLVAWEVLGRSFAELEDRSVRRNMERALGALSEILEALDARCVDWAAWDDTYEFVVDRNEEYIRANLVDTTFVNQRFHLMLFVDTTGRIVFGKAFDLAAGVETPLPPGLKEHLVPDAPLLRHGPDGRSGTKGVLMLPAGPMLVAARPILTSEYGGPARGTLIIGRFLDRDEIARLAATTRLSLEFRRPDVPDLPEDWRAAVAALAPGVPLVRPLDGERVAGYTLVSDVYGRPALALGVEVPREIYREGRVALRYFGLSLLAVGLVAGAATWLLLERMVLSPLARLGEEVRRVGQAANAGARVAPAGGGELASLAGSINETLAALERTQRRLRESEELFKTVATSSPIGIYIVQEGKFRFVNPRFELHTGYDREELLGMDSLALVLPEDRDAVQDNVIQMLKGERSAPYEFRVVTKQGEVRWVMETVASIRCRGERAVLGNYMDVTEQKRTEEALRRSEREKALILDAMLELVVYQDAEMRVLWANRAAAASVGLSPEQLVGRRCYEVWHGRDRPCEGCPVEAALHSGEPREGEVRSPDGRFWFIRAYPVRDERGRVAGAVEVALEITERRRMEEELKFFTFHDALTGLYNRAYFDQEMERLEGGRYAPVSVVMWDVDGLKLVNDVLGHDAGDRVLIAAATVTRKCFRSGDVVARIGGDEFAALLPRAPRPVVEDVCRRIREAVAAYNASGPELPLGVAVGCATGGADACLRDLLREADHNMYLDKLLGNRGAREAVVAAVFRKLEELDRPAAARAGRVRKLAAALARAAGLGERQTADLLLLARYHDIGRVRLGECAVSRPEGALTPEERREVERHPELGYRIALSVPELAPVADLILKHRERWDGRGYPLGLKGEEIPPECRVLAVAEAYAALVADPPAGEGLGPEEAAARLRDLAGSALDPRLVALFLERVVGEGAA